MQILLKKIHNFFENFNGPLKNHHKTAQNQATDLFEVSMESWEPYQYNEEVMNV